MSSVSKTDIVNAALRHLGCQRVSSIDENVPRAKVIKDIYDMVRRKLLEEMKPSFAIGRSELTQSGTDPDFGYENQYELPNDFLLAIKENNDYAYEIEGDKLLCDESEVHLIYVKDVTNTALMSSAFVEALYMKLAAEAAYTLTESISNRRDLIQQAMVAKEEAMSSDSVQDDSKNVLEPDVFLGGRS